MFVLVSRQFTKKNNVKNTSELSYKKQGIIHVRCCSTQTKKKINSKYFAWIKFTATDVATAERSFIMFFILFSSIHFPIRFSKPKPSTTASAYSSRTHYGEPIHGNMLETRSAMKMKKKEEICLKMNRRRMNRFSCVSPSVLVLLRLNMSKNRRRRDQYNNGNRKNRN